MVQAPAPPMFESDDAWRARAQEAARMALEPLASSRYGASQVAGPSAPPAPFQLAATSGQVIPQILGMSGRRATIAAPTPVIRRAGSQNGIFVEFDRARWFSSGSPAPLDRTRLSRIGESHGFPVYMARGGDGSTIFVPVGQDMDFVAPYTRRK
jgi:hypothetical protein